MADQYRTATSKMSPDQTSDAAKKMKSKKFLKAFFLVPLVPLGVGFILVNSLTFKALVQC